MAVLPTSQRQVQFAPQPIESSASVFVALGQSFGKVEKAEEKDITKNSKDALEANKFMVASDAIKQNSAIFDEASKQPNKEQALKQYKTSLQSYADVTLANTPKTNKVYTERLLFTLGNKGAKTLETQIAKQGQVSEIIHQDDVSHSFLSLATNEIGNVDEASQRRGETFFGQYEQSVRLNVGNGRTAAGAAKIIEGGRSQLHMAKMEGWNRHLLNQPDGAQKSRDFIGEVLSHKKYNSTFTSDERKTTASKMKTDASNFLEKQGISKQQYEDTKADNMQETLRRGSVNQTKMARIHDMDPNADESYNVDVQRAALRGSVINRFKHATIPERLAEISKLSQPLSKVDQSKPGAAQEVIERNLTKTAIQSDLDKFRDNPSTEIEKTEVYRNGVENIKTTVMNKNPGTQGSEEQVGDAFRATLALKKSIQTNRGIPANKVSYIDGPDATTLVNQVQAITSPQGLKDWFTGFKSQYGKFAPQALVNLKNAGLSVGSNILLNASQNPRSAALYPTGARSFLQPLSSQIKLLPDSGDKKKIEGFVGPLLAPLNASFGPADGLTSDYLADLKEQVNRLAIGFRIAGASNSKAAQDAYDMAIGNNFNMISFNPGLAGRFNIGGNMVRAPIDINPNIIKNGMQAVYTVVSESPEMIKNAHIPEIYRKQWGDLLSEKDLAIQYNEDEVKNGYFLTTHDGSGMTFMTSQQTPYLTKSGKKLEVSYKALANPGSDLYSNVGKILSQSKSINKLLQKRLVEGPENLLSLITHPLPRVEERIKSDLLELHKVTN